MPSYLESCQSEFWKEVFQEEVQYLTRALQGCHDVLSVGCGPAIIERALHEQGFNVTGLDVSEEALTGAPDSIRTFVGSAENMAMLLDASFDAVLYVASLQFIDDYERALQETARVLRPEGKLVVMMLNPDSHFFHDKRRQTASYVNTIKHPYLQPILDAIHQSFRVLETTYYLGIQGNRVVSSHDPKIASLYIVQGVKR